MYYACTDYPAEFKTDAMIKGLVSSKFVTGSTAPKDFYSTKTKALLAPGISTSESEKTTALVSRWPLAKTVPVALTPQPNRTTNEDGATIYTQLMPYFCSQAEPNPTANCPEDILTGKQMATCSRMVSKSGPCRDWVTWARKNTGAVLDVAQAAWCTQNPSARDCACINVSREKSNGQPYYPLGFALVKAPHVLASQASCFWNPCKAIGSGGTGDYLLPATNKPCAFTGSNDTICDNVFSVIATDHSTVNVSNNHIRNATDCTTNVTNNTTTQGGASVPPSTTTTTTTTTTKTRSTATAATGFLAKLWDPPVLGPSIEDLPNAWFWVFLMVGVVLIAIVAITIVVLKRAARRKRKGKASQPPLRTVLTEKQK
jgi:hypothetical protein